MKKKSGERVQSIIRVEASAVPSSAEDIKSKIYTIRGVQVMLDRDLASLYGVLTKNLNKAVKRNQERFPEDFMFRLTRDESLRFQIGTSNGSSDSRVIDLASESDSLRFQNGTSRLNNLEAEIDEMVFNHYGLTSEGREIVKGGWK